jgi:hypothetical protein
MPEEYTYFDREDIRKFPVLGKLTNNGTKPLIVGCEIPMANTGETRDMTGAVTGPTTRLEAYEVQESKRGLVRALGIMVEAITRVFKH